MTNYLYQKLDAVREMGFISPLPDIIPSNLTANIKIRPYQQQAWENFITQFTNPKTPKGSPMQLLFNMATGSGKTLIMAGLIIYLYNQGYRNFLFFVNQKNIIAKTKENFLNPQSPKYLFSQDLNISGKKVFINPVANFQNSLPEAINICFASVQQLHIDLSSPKENQLTTTDFVQDKLVLISDESHHINADTKKGNKKQKLAEESWENSIYQIFQANPNNILLEFTATCDLNNPYIQEKYSNKIVFDYPLAKFREDKYTKEFYSFTSDSEPWDRALQALILSQYRLKIFEHYGLLIKPVILMKSRTIKESLDFAKLFEKKLHNLKPKEIQKFDVTGVPLLSQAFAFFHQNNISHEMLCIDLQHSFNYEHTIIMNSEADFSPAKQVVVNTLESANNPIRLIFTVDMLNEGWDVLNLFDIVRLYDTRQSGGKTISPYTISEAQLIGRGARYCPFVLEPNQEKYQRKYDNDTQNPLRICETILYHSKHNSRYIDELQKALEETGLLPTNYQEITLTVKDSFKKEEFYKSGVLFTNSQIPHTTNPYLELIEDLPKKVYPIELTQGKTTLLGLFTAEEVSSKIKECKHNISLHTIPWYILYKAALQLPTLKFCNLQQYYPDLTSLKEFLTTANYLGNCQMLLTTNSEQLNNQHLYAAAVNFLTNFTKTLENTGSKHVGTNEFTPIYVHEMITDKTRKIEVNSQYGEGISQNFPTLPPHLKMDLQQCEWYVFNDNYGTVEEKEFVVNFAAIIPHLQKNFDKVFLIRNERQITFYDFDTGKGFEPDYLLILQKYRQQGFEQVQVLIEPKGEHLIPLDQWKEEFMLALSDKAKIINPFVDNNTYQIVGMPFFNTANSSDFTTALSKLI